MARCPCATPGCAEDIEGAPGLPAHDAVVAGVCPGGTRYRLDAEHTSVPGTAWNDPEIRQAVRARVTAVSSREVGLLLGHLDAFAVIGSHHIRFGAHLPGMPGDIQVFDPFSAMLSGRPHDALDGADLDQRASVGWLLLEARANFPRSCFGSRENFHGWTGLNPGSPANLKRN